MGNVKILWAGTKIRRGTISSTPHIGATVWWFTLWQTHDCTDTSLCNNSHFLRAGGLYPHQEAIVFVVVGDDDAAFLFHGQHILHIVLDVGSRLIECLVNILGGETDNVETVLQFADDAAYFVVRFFL